jgi:hypothetical protein
MRKGISIILLIIGTIVFIIGFINIFCLLPFEGMKGIDIANIIFIPIIGVLPISIALLIITEIIKKEVIKKIIKYIAIYLISSLVFGLIIFIIINVLY